MFYDVSWRAREPDSSGDPFCGAMTVGFSAEVSYTLDPY